MASYKQYEKNGDTFIEAAVYVGRDDLTGRPRYKHKRGFYTKKEARLWAASIELAADRGDLTKQVNYTFEQVYAEWFASYKNTVRPATWVNFKGMLDNHVIPTLGKQRVKRLTPKAIQQAVTKWSGESDVAYKQWFALTKRVLKYAVERCYILNNPADPVVLPKRQDEAGDVEENFWDKSELEAFFNMVDPIKQVRWYTLFWVLAFSGMRIGEAMALTWADVNFSNNTIRINKTASTGDNNKYVVQPPKTKAGRRTLSMDAQTMALLKHWRVSQIQLFLARGVNTNTPEQLVFPTNKNTLQNVRSPYAWLMNFEDKHKIDHQINVHGFRHSHASALFAAGATIKEVQQRMGHERVETTLSIYTHVTAKQETKAAEKVAAYLNFGNISPKASPVLGKIGVNTLGAAVQG